METAQLTSSQFWQDEQSHAFANLRDAQQVASADLLQPWLEQNLPSHLCFATSGSTGKTKWVAVSKHAMLASATAVNEHLQVTESDRWLLALPTFHVGGMGIIARVFQAGCQLEVFSQKWSAPDFLTALKNHTLTSLVPTQLVDLIALKKQPPATLRAVLIGGGKLSDALYQQAVELGWPIIETYGMTEACSQIATATLDERNLKPLPCWQLDTQQNRLRIKGTPLFTGYISADGSSWKLTTATTNEWFLTNDIVSLENDFLHVIGRTDRCVKILGELVNLDAVSTQENTTVVALPDARRENRLILCIDANQPNAADLLETHNAQCPPHHRIDHSHMLPFPRSPLGKIQYQKLTALVAAMEAGRSGDV